MDRLERYVEKVKLKLYATNTILPKYLRYANAGKSLTILVADRLKLPACSNYFEIWYKVKIQVIPTGLLHFVRNDRIGEGISSLK